MARGSWRMYMKWHKASVRLIIQSTLVTQACTMLRHVGANNTGNDLSQSSHLRVSSLQWWHQHWRCIDYSSWSAILKSNILSVLHLQVGSDGWRGDMKEARCAYIMWRAWIWSRVVLIKSMCGQQNNYREQLTLKNSSKKVKNTTKQACAPKVNGLEENYFSPQEIIVIIGSRGCNSTSEMRCFLPPNNHVTA